jgi:rubrerythrin
MDKNTAAALENFCEVWERVCGRGAESGGAGDVLGTLREFIADEACAAAFYAACAQRGGRFSARLRELERDERGHLRTLQGEYFLLTGEKCLPPGSCPLPRGGLRALRSAYLDELAAAEGYRRAAEAPENADLAAIYLRHASDEERHAGILKELILCAL